MISPILNRIGNDQSSLGPLMGLANMMLRNNAQKAQGLAQALLTPPERNMAPRRPVTGAYGNQGAAQAYGEVFGKDPQSVYRGWEGVDPRLREFYEALVPVAKQQLGYTPSIGETLRSPDRQRWLYAQGRTRPGPIVTKTLNSRHLKGLAMDLLLPKGVDVDAFTKIAYPLAQRYGIGHLGAWDPLHFQLPWR